MKKPSNFEIFMRAKSGFTYLLILLVALAFIGCKKKAAQPTEIAFPITMGGSTLADVPVILSSFGTLSSPNTVNIRAQVSGEIITVPLKEGSFIKQGDLLVAIDPSPFLADLQHAKGQVQSALAAASYAKQSYESYKQMQEQDFISVLDLANYLKNYQVADASVITNLANLETAKINLGYTQITAPINGVVGFMGYREGNIANTTDTLVTLVQIQPLYVLFNLSEQDLYALRQAQEIGTVSIEASFLAKDQPHIAGYLHAIDNTVNTKTGTIAMKAEFPNNDLSAWPGEFVKLNLHLKTLPEAVIIDKMAVQYGQNGPYVYVIDTTMHVEIRNVTLGPLYGDKQISIAGGLTAGEHVVTDGQLNLYPGAKVFVSS